MLDMDIFAFVLLNFDGTCGAKSNHVLVFWGIFILLVVLFIISKHLNILCSRALKVASLAKFLAVGKSTKFFVRSTIGVVNSPVCFSAKVSRQESIMS